MMNWKRGLIRVWLVCSALWIVGVVAFVAHAPIVATTFSYPTPTGERSKSPLGREWSAAEIKGCVDARKSNGSLGNLFSCGDERPEPHRSSDFIGNATTVAIVGFSPPIALIVLGLAGVWIARGFRVL